MSSSISGGSFLNRTPATPSILSSTFHSISIPQINEFGELVLKGPAVPAISRIKQIVLKTTVSGTQAVAVFLYKNSPESVQSAFSTAAANVRERLDPIVSRPAQYISAKSVSLVAENVAEMAISHGKTAIKNYFEGLQKKAEDDQMDLQQRQKLLEAALPQLKIDLTEQQMKLSSSFRVKQMEQLAKELNDAAASLSKDAASEQLEKEIKQLVDENERATTALKAFDNDPEYQLKRSWFWLDPQMESLKAKIKFKKDPLLATQSVIEGKLKVAKENLANHRATLRCKLLTQETHFKDCRIDEVFKAEAPLPEIYARLAEVMTKLEDCNHRIGLTQYAPARWVGVTRFVDSDLLKERESIEKEKLSIQQELAEKEMPANVLREAIKNELQALHEVNETLAELECDMTKSYFWEQRILFLCYHVITPVEITRDTSANLKKQGEQISQLKEELPKQQASYLKTLPKAIKFTTLASARLLRGKLVTPIKRGLGKGLSTGGRWVAYKVADWYLISRLANLVPWAVSTLNESDPGPTAYEICPNPNPTLDTFKFYLGTLGTCLVAYRAIQTVKAFQKDRTRERQFLEKTLHYGLEEGLGTMPRIPKSVANAIAEVVAAELTRFVEKYAKEKGLDLTLVNIQKFCNQIVDLTMCEMKAKNDKVEKVQDESEVKEDGEVVYYKTNKETSLFGQRISMVAKVGRLIKTGIALGREAREFEE